MAFEHFPYTNFHDLNLDWIIQKIKECYSPDNPPTNVVLSVNGETGDVVLYKNAVVQLPVVDETTWGIFRKADNADEGIQFIKGSKAQRIDGTNRYDIYDAGNPPAYPVTSVNGDTGDVVCVKSVNGQTGIVTLYPNAVIQFPAVDETTWAMFRKSDNTDEGIQFIKGTKAQRIDGTYRYDIYDEGNPPPYPVTSVNNLTGAVAILDTSIVTDGGTQKIKIAFPVTTVDGATGTVTTWGASGNSVLKPPVTAQGDVWGFQRDIPSGTIGISFEYDDNNSEAAGYIVFNDGVNPQTKLKILTPSDIPSSSGVVSFNGQTGAVTCTGADLNMSSSDTTKVSTAIGNNAIAVVSKIAKTAITATPETSTTATHNYSVGDYVLVNNTLYRVTASISSGDTISSSNATEVTVGSELTSLNGQIGTHTLLGQQASAGECSLSEDYTHFVFVEIVPMASDRYAQPLVISTEVLKSLTSNDYYCAILEYVVSTSTITTARIWHVSNTKISVRTSCMIYGVIRK